MEFVNDPQFDGLPLAGESHVLVARRTECGRAVRWVPGGDVVALAEFLGPSFPVVGGELYERRPDGSLFPVDLKRPCWAVVPPAGEPVLRGPDGFTAGWAQVVAVDAPVTPVAAPSLDEQADVFRQGWEAGFQAAREDAGLLDPASPAADVALLSQTDTTGISLVDLSAAVASSSAGAPGGDAGEPSPADTPVKRGPGRPKKVVADGA